VDASEIEVQVSNGEVTLTGTVDSREAKRAAEEAAEECSGVKDVQNRIRVQSESRSGQSGRYEAGSQSSYGSMTGQGSSQGTGTNRETESKSKGRTSVGNPS